MARRDEISLDSLTLAVGPITCLFEATVHRGADRLSAAGTKQCLVMLVGRERTDRGDASRAL